MHKKTMNGDTVHPTIQTLYSICKEYIAFGVLEKELKEYLKVVEQTVPNFQAWLDTLLPLVQKNYFLGYLTGPCVVEAIKDYLDRETMCSLVYNKHPSTFILFLSSKYPGQVIVRGISKERDPNGPGLEYIIAEFDPVGQQVPPKVYKLMTTQYPLCRMDYSLYVYNVQHNDYSVLKYFHCDTCGRISMSEKWYEFQVRFNRSIEYINETQNTRRIESIPCPQCKKTNIVLLSK